MNIKELELEKLKENNYITEDEHLRIRGSVQRNTLSAFIVMKIIVKLMKKLLEIQEKLDKTLDNTIQNAANISISQQETETKIKENKKDKNLESKVHKD